MLLKKILKKNYSICIWLAYLNESIPNHQSPTTQPQTPNLTQTLPQKQQIQIICIQMDKKILLNTNPQPQNLSHDTLNLIKQVQRFVIDNKRLYQQIRDNDPNFYCKLYQPIDYHGIDEMFVKPLLLRQVDQLLEERQALSMKKQVMSYVMMQEKKKQEQELLNNSNHFFFLRSTWTKLQSYTLNSAEKIDNLNKIVGILKNNIKQLNENQQKIINKQLKQDCPKKMYITAKYQQKLRQQIQRLKMRNQELETKCIRYDQIIGEKNKKIQLLECQLYHAGIRIKDSIDTLNVTLQKLQSLKKSKNFLEGELKRVQGLGDQGHYAVFSSNCEEWNVKISGNMVGENKMEETQKSLNQIIQFLRSKPSAPTKRTFLDTASSQVQVPFLNLNLSRSPSDSATTDRQLSKLSKFIPMRTQRSCILRSQQANRVNNIEQAEESIQEVSEGLVHDSSSKRFTRKADFPLTSERFRKGKIQDQRLQSIFENQPNS